MYALYVMPPPPPKKKTITYLFWCVLAPIPTTIIQVTSPFDFAIPRNHSNIFDLTVYCILR